MEIRTRGFEKEFNERIQDYIQRINAEMKKELSRYASSRFYGPLIYAVEGGKRVRPLILILCKEAVGRQGPDPWPAAVGIELLHTESLIHDDIIDEEVSRREKMAFHLRYGYNASMLTADFVFGMILDIASRYTEPKIARALSSAALRMCEGEFGELKIDPSIHQVTVDEYINLLSMKTASLFETAARVGALLGNGSESQIDALAKYGLHLGIAYQIQDDILDWRREGKLTRAIKSDDDAATLAGLKRMAEEYATGARKQLSVVETSDARNLLEELADFSVSREY